MMKRLVIALALLTAAAQPARATMITNIGGTIVGGVLVGGTNYLDNQAGVDSNPIFGIMDIGTFLNGVSVNFVIKGFTAISASAIASLTMNLNANVASAAPLAVDIFISDVGYFLPLQFAHPRLSQTVNLLSSVGGITANATAEGFYGDSNLNFDVDGLNTGFALASISNGVGTNVVATSEPMTGPFPYSLTSAIHLNITSRGLDPIQNLQLNANLSALADAPEPQTWMLVAAGIGFYAIRSRWRHG